MTETRIPPNLAERLSAEQRASLDAALRDGASLADALMQLDSMELLTILAGPSAALTPEEAEDMYRAVRPPRSGRWQLPALFAAAAAILAIVTAAGLASLSDTRADLYQPSDNLRKTLLKPGVPHVRMRLFAGEESAGGARVTRELGPSGTIEPGEAVLFRVLVDVPCHTYLLVSEDGAAPEALDAPGLNAWHDVGEHEFGTMDSALAYIPERGTRTTTFAVLASERPLDPARLASELRTLDTRSLRQSCQECGIFLGEVTVSGAP